MKQKLLIDSAYGDTLESLVNGMKDFGPLARQTLIAVCNRAYLAIKSDNPTIVLRTNTRECSLFVPNLRRFGFENACDLLGYQFKEDASSGTFSVISNEASLASSKKDAA